MRPGAHDNQCARSRYEIQHYNAHGLPLTITDPNGGVTTLTYDARQRLPSRTVGTDQSAYEYWPTGLFKKTTLPNGSYLVYSYDAAQRLTDISDAEGNQVHYVLARWGTARAKTFSIRLT